MQLTPVCDPFPHCVVLLVPMIDSSKTHTQMSCVHPLRLGFLGFFFFFFVTNRFFPISKLSDAEFSSLISKKPAY